jgi:hypothetical protein
MSSTLLYKNLRIQIYKSVILPIVSHECETWSVTLREECRLRVFENRVPRRVFRCKRDDVTGKWRRLYNEELHDLHHSTNIIRVIK